MQQQRKQQQQQQQQQPTNTTDVTFIRYITACDELWAAPQVSFLPGLQQRVLEPGRSAEDGFQVARPGLRDKGLQVHVTSLQRALS